MNFERNWTRHSRVMKIGWKKSLDTFGVSWFFHPIFIPLSCLFQFLNNCCLEAGASRQQLFSKFNGSRVIAIPLVIQCVTNKIFSCIYFARSTIGSRASGLSRLVTGRGAVINELETVLWATLPIRNVILFKGIFSGNSYSLLLQHL